MKKEQNELDILLPEKDIVINGERIEVRPFHFAKLPKMIGVLSEIGKEVYSLIQVTKKQLKFNEKGDIIITPDLLNVVEPIFANNFPTVAEIMGFYTNKDADYFLDETNDFDYEKGILLVCRIVEQNYDFFTKRLAPALKAVQSQTAIVTANEK